MTSGDSKKFCIREFWRGFRDILPVCLAASTVALIFGAVAAEKGLSFFETTLLSASVYAGASQFMALQFWQEQLPYLTIVLVVLAVNFRHVLYSASLSRKLFNFSPVQRAIAFFFLVDPNFALGEKRHEESLGEHTDPGLTPAYYFGIATPLYPLWVIFSMIGYVFGNLVENPERYGLDFILTFYFLVLLMGFRARSNWLAVVIVAAVSGFIVLQTLGSPWHISCGAMTGVLTGAILGRPATKQTSS